MTLEQKEALRFREGVNTNKIYSVNNLISKGIAKDECEACEYLGYDFDEYEAVKKIYNDFYDIDWSVVYEVR